MDRAELLTAAGRPEDALDLYDRILDLYPESFRAHLGRGLAAVTTGDTDLAEHSWHRAADLGPRDTRAWTNLRILYRRSGDVPAAIEAFERALRIDGTNHVVTVQLEELRATERD